MSTPLSTFRRFGDYPHRKLADLPKRETDKEQQYGGWKTGNTSKMFGTTSFKGYEKSFLLERITRREDLPPRPDPLTLTSTLGPPPPPPAIEPLVLTPEVLLAAHRTRLASDIYSSRHIDEHVCAVEGDFSAFVNVTHLNCSDNLSLGMEQFAGFPALTALQLAMNAITDIVLPASQFRTLTILDLSYNNLSQDALVHLARLPELTALDLTGNELLTLPLGMSGFSHVDGQPVLHYGKLENLILDRNTLSGPAVFAALAGLPRLRYVSMTHNKIGFIPHLVAAGHAAVDAFPALAILNLSHNPLLAAEDVLEAALFPRMQVLIITHTPLVQAHRGLPTEVTAVLVQGRGIRVVTNERRPRRAPIVLNPATMVVVGPALPKLPTAADRVALLPPALPNGDESQADASEEQGGEEEEQDEEEEVQEGPRGPGFFMTELDDDDDGEGEEEEEEEGRARLTGGGGGSRTGQARVVSGEPGARSAVGSSDGAGPKAAATATAARSALSRTGQGQGRQDGPSTPTPTVATRQESILFGGSSTLVQASTPRSPQMTMRACDLPFEELLADGDEAEQQHRRALTLASPGGPMAAARALEFALQHPNLGASRPPPAAKKPRPVATGPAAESRARTRAQQLEQTLASMRLRAATVDAPLVGLTTRPARPSGSAPAARTSHVTAGRASVGSTTTSFTTKTAATGGPGARPSEPRLRTLQVSFNAAVTAAASELLPSQ